MAAWNEFVILMKELNILSVFVRLFIAALCGAIVGADRAKKQRPAGFRTHMLVCVGSALVMITNQYIAETYGMGDPARLGAQVISGIGFLGAGTIIVTQRNQVMGLTTAAGLWASACMGLAVGIGFYSGAILGAIFVFFIVVVMQSLDDWLHSTSRYMQVYAELEQASVLSALLTFASQNGIKIEEVEVVPARNVHDHMGTMILMRLPKRMEHIIIIEQFSAIDGVVFVNTLE